MFFSQPDAASLSINRVTGGDPSGILGAENGRVGDLLLDPDTVTIRGGSDDGRGSAATVCESDLEALNANIPIQAGRRIEANGDFIGNEFRIAPDRDFRLELVNGGSGGIASSAARESG